MSVPHTGRLYPQGNTPGTHSCQRLSQPPGHCATGSIMSMKNEPAIFRLATACPTRKMRTSRNCGSMACDKEMLQRRCFFGFRLGKDTRQMKYHEGQKLNGTHQRLVCVVFRINTRKGHKYREDKQRRAIYTSVCKLVYNQTRT